MRATREHEHKRPRLGGRRLEPHSFTAVYYDVPGGSLAASGITVLRRTEHARTVWQLKLPEGDELEEDGGSAHAPEAIVRLLRAHLRRGPLECVAELDGRREPEGFVDVEIELRTGNPQHLDLIARELRDAGAQGGVEIPKLFHATAPAEEARLPALEAVRAGLLEQLREIEAHDPGTRLGRDPESLHDMRVAVRRARAFFRTGRRVIGNDTKAIEHGLKELGKVLGEVRDLDVFIERLRVEADDLEDDDRKAVQAAIGSLDDERAAARRLLLLALDSDGYLRLLDDLERTARELTPSGDGSTLCDLVDRQAAKLRKIAKSLPKDPADDELHAFRKAGKRARYAAELAGNSKVVKRAKRFQDVLGEHQDAVVAGERLRELALAGDVELAVAAGRIAEREEARRREARTSWPKAWQRLKKAL